MGRPKKAVPAPAEIEPEEVSQEIPEDEPEVEEEDADEPGASRPAISKADAVREALAQGKEGPEEGTDYIRSQYGIEMPRQMFSSYKAQEKARQAKKAGGVPATPAPAPRQQPAAPPVARTPAAPVASGGIIADIADIKRLLATHGKDGLEELIRVLG